MDLELILAAISAALCAIPLALTVWNLRLYQPPRAGAHRPDKPPRVFACIPARNEADNIEPCVRSLLAGGDEDVRVLVYDDQSEDGTGEIVRALAEADARVRLVPTRGLPTGWNGKQHACWRMARAAIDGEIGESPAGPDDLLLFTDADVRFEPDALPRACAGMRRLGAPMVSTFPRQITRTFMESIIVPMIFHILFGYLPMARMRGSTDPGASAGCGQFLLITVDAYEKCGGHAGFKDTMHDGIKLPRAVRRTGMRTDLFDGTDLCSVRMYDGLAAAWRGFTKNAFEGLGSPAVLGFFTAVHIFGHLMPWALLLLALGGVVALTPALVTVCVLAIALQLAQRLMLALRLSHSVLGALLHPIGIVLLTAIQWHSYVLHLTGRRSWRGRMAGATAEREPTAG